MATLWRSGLAETSSMLPMVLFMAKARVMVI